MLYYPVIDIDAALRASGLFALFRIYSTPVMIAEDIIQGLIQYGYYKLQVAIGEVTARYYKIYISHPFLYGWSIDYIYYLIADYKYFHKALFRVKIIFL